jgi:hypothetical protein
VEYVDQYILESYDSGVSQFVCPYVTCPEVSFSESRRRRQCFSFVMYLPHFKPALPQHGVMPSLHVSFTVRNSVEVR